VHFELFFMNDQTQPKLQGGAGRLAKRIILAIATAGLWVFMLKYLQETIVLREYQYWLLPALLIIILIPVIALSAITLPKRVFLLLALGLSGAYLVFFPFDVIALPAVLTLFFGFWRAFHRAQFEQENNVRFAPNHLVKRVSSMMILVLLLVISANVYQSIAEEIRQDADAFYSRLARGVTKGVLPIVERQLTSFNAGQTLDEFIVEGFEENTPEFLAMSPEERAQQISASRERIVDQFGITATGREPLSDITQRAVEAQISELVSPRYAWLVPVIYSLAIFSLLRILAVIGQLITQAWGIFIFWLMRKTEFIRITTTQIPAEKVEI